jgi:multicomponent Na+:H+ antiporter subunit D
MDSLVVFPVAIPLLTATLLIAGRWLLPLRVVELIGIASAGSAVVLSVLVFADARDELVVHWFGGWQPRHGIALGISFAVDPLGAGLAVLAGVLVTAALVYSYHYYEEAGALYHVLMLVFLGGMSGFAFSGDLFNLFVFFALMGVAAFALTAYRIEEVGPIQGAINFAVTNSIAGVMLLLGVTLLYGHTGALSLAQIGNALGGEKPDGLLVVAFLLIATAFFVKAAIVPFHFWLADAYAVAPSPVCAVLAGVMSDLGIYGLARVYWSVFEGPLGEYESRLRALLVALGILTALTGALMCFLQHHLKRLLAYSTISDMGILLAGIALLESQGLAGVAVYVLAHGFLKGALFLATGIVLQRRRTVDEFRLRGRGRSLPLVATAFIACAVGLAGLPPLGVSLGHSLLGEGARTVGYAWLPAVLALASAVTAAAIFRVWARVFLGLGPVDAASRTRETGEREPEHEREGAGGRRRRAVLTAPMLALATAGVLVFVLPGLPESAERSAERFVDRPAYTAAVLEGRTPPLPAEPPPHRVSFSSLLYGVGSVLGAALLAALSLIEPRRQLAKLTSRAAPVVGVLRTAHSGHVGDYVAWLTAGSAALGILVTLALT